MERQQRIQRAMTRYGLTRLAAIRHCELQQSHDSKRRLRLRRYPGSAASGLGASAHALIASFEALGPNDPAFLESCDLQPGDLPAMESYEQDDEAAEFDPDDFAPEDFQ